MLHLYLVARGGVFSYNLLLLTWASLHALFADRWWWLFLLNSFAVYYFAPLPVMLVAALLLCGRVLLISTGVVAALAFYLYGGQLLAWLPRAAHDGPRLRVMSYNLLGFNTQTDAVIAALRAADADVVGLQELNPQVAAAVGRALADVYPYQVLDPQGGTSGMGIISRYPLRSLDARLDVGNWVGLPQLLQLDWQGQRVMLVNIHAAYVDLESRAGLQASIGYREQQARAVVAFAATRAEPLIVLGDWNATEQSTVHATLTTHLTDAWRTAGRGFGHTFPGGTSPGGSRPEIGGWLVPQWLVRIDYVFCSRAWQVVAAQVGPWDGYSDHRPVMVTLALQ